MSDNRTLLAYLVPRLTGQVENTATDALGYILNKSATSMDALNDLLQQDDFDIPPISRVETQVTYEDGSRPDMAGYDQANAKRLLVESKFWAALLEGQASGYLNQFDQPGPAVLLFIAPDLRIETLWSEITRQIGQRNPGAKLDPTSSSDGLRSAMVAGAEKRLMLISWVKLLDSMAAATGDEGVKSDIRQLRGLAMRQDAEAFLPMRSEELGPDLALRMVGYTVLVDDVVDARGVPDKWMTTRGLRATPQWYGYGRYFRFAGVPGDFWFGINYELWAGSADTPLWLWDRKSRFQARTDEILKELNVQVQDDWVPIYPKMGVEYHAVLDDVASQLKAVAKIVRVDLTTCLV